ncbi:Heterogeneous nuclear ribonucleoprotein Q [Vitis vinifera]|uniref:Heterogeneous nuclear ribonucleoprotein Q n=1 Tax=Vitis vinifera TaxID=29760 RepID=A0A438HRB1_VITVI|nr:Heterogeneous nuclear ribonucleoprotein Q [Vitis vinifera]
MPRAKGNASATCKPVEPEKLSEPEKPIESDERVDLDEDNDPDEAMDEEVEYEEVEVEEEVEEVEEEVEEEEVEEEEEEVEEEEEEEEANEADEQKSPSGGGGKMKTRMRAKNMLSFLPCHLMVLKYMSAGRKIKCSTSQAKHRLFIGNVPRSWGEEDIKKVVTEIGPGVTAVELVKDMKNSSNNRGFAFIDYYNHSCAEYSRQKMMNPKFKLDNNAPTVSWADPKNADSSPASQVKAVYVKNLPKNITQDQLKQLFEHHGKITKVVLPQQNLDRKRVELVLYTLQRGQARFWSVLLQSHRQIRNLLVDLIHKNQVLLSSYPPRVGYGFVGGAYGALGAGYGTAGFAQWVVALASHRSGFITGGLIG